MPVRLTTNLDQLFFDPHNPRFIASFGDDENKMFRYLITDVGVDDLLQSISASGLIEGDPIIVREKGKAASGKDEYYVIEGNRRLAALKLLTGSRPNDERPIPEVPDLSEDKVAALKTDIPVQKDWSENLLEAYLGYKHVTASKEWTPEAKAKFVFEHANGDFSRERLTEFAKKLGTTYATLRRWLLAFLLLRQAGDAGLFDPDDVPTKRFFGTFYTLLGGAEAKKFLALVEDPIANRPVPDDHLGELGSFVKWTIGTQERPAVVNSRQQAKFEQVLSSPAALEYFEVKHDLENALLYTEYNADEVAGKLREAAYSVEECLPKLNDVRERPNVQDAFNGLEKAYRKARLNMQEEPPST